MKNKIVTLAGGLLLLAILGRFYAAPAIAQAVKAALVQYRDSPPRQAFTIKSTFTPSLIHKIQPITFPSVPAGKRMMITSVTGTVAVGVATTATYLMVIETSNGHESRQLLSLTSPSQEAGIYSGVTPLHLPMNPGDSGTVAFDSTQAFTSATAVFTGYTIDVP